MPFSSSEAAFDLTPVCPCAAIRETSTTARAGFFEAAWWRFTAPPGTVVDRLRIARYGYRFLDVDDTRTTRSGRWRASDVFRGVPGRYPVRLKIRRANGFPFELGYSPRTTVRVR